MSVAIKPAEEIAKMRVAGKLAAEVLDFIAPHVKAGVTTDELDRLCHDYMVEVQNTVPAPLNYAPPGTRHIQNQSAPQSITWFATACLVTKNSRPAISSILTLPSSR